MNNQSQGSYVLKHTSYHQPVSSCGAGDHLKLLNDTNLSGNCLLTYKLSKSPFFLFTARHFHIHFQTRRLHPYIIQPAVCMQCFLSVSCILYSQHVVYHLLFFVFFTPGLSNSNRKELIFDTDMILVKSYVFSFVFLFFHAARPFPKQTLACRNTSTH